MLHIKYVPFLKTQQQPFHSVFNVFNASKSVLFMFIVTPRVDCFFTSRSSPNWSQHNNKKVHESVNSSVNVYISVWVHAHVFVVRDNFSLPEGENTGMYLLVFVFPCFPPLLGLVYMPPSSPSFLCVAEMKTKQSWTWSLHTNTHTDTHKRRCKHTPCVVLHVLKSSHNCRLKVKMKSISSVITLKMYLLWGAACHHVLSVFTFILQTEEHFRASRHLAITVTHISIMMIILNLKYYTFALG